MLPHAGVLVCPPPRHRLSGHSPHTLWLIFNTIPTILAAFPPRFAALPKPRSDPRCRSNPIAHRVRRKRQRLPPSLLIENASDRDPRSTPTVCPEAFPIKASDHSTLIARASLNCESNCRPGWGLAVQSGGSRELQCLNVCLGSAQGSLRRNERGINMFPALFESGPFFPEPIVTFLKY